MRVAGREKGAFKSKRRRIKQSSNIRTERRREEKEGEKTGRRGAGSVQGVEGGFSSRKGH